MSTPQWTPRGRLPLIPGPPGKAWETMPFTMQGQVRVQNGMGRFPIKGGTFRLETVTAAVEIAPSGSEIVLDVLKNGTSIYAEPNDRPRILPGTNRSVEAAHVETYLTDGDYLNVDVVAVGSVVSGAFLTAVVRLQQTVAFDAT